MSSVRKKNMLILLSLLFLFSISLLLTSLETNIQSDLIINNSDIIKDNLLLDNQLKTQDLSNNNEYIGIGASWNVTHYANRTDSDIISIENNTSQISKVKTGFGWQGYKLNTTIEGLIDKRQWINGTMHFGADDGNNASGSDDSSQLQGWDFVNGDIGATNQMSGNYFDNIYYLSDGHDCLELRMNGQGGPLRYTYEAADEAYWIYSKTIDRGNVIDSTLSFDIKPTHLCPSNYWGFKVEINDKTIYSKGNGELYDLGIGSWTKVTLPQEIWINDSAIFQNPLYTGPIEIRFVIECTAAGNYQYGPEDGVNVNYQQVLFDNVELEIIAEAQPTQVNLELNGTDIENVAWGKGFKVLEGKWNGTEIDYVYGNFSSQGSGDFGSYTIDFDVNMNLYAQKTNQPTLYEENAISEGTGFLVGNNTNIDWNCYSFISTPTAYKESSMRVELPEDVNITWVSSATQPSINRAYDACDNSTRGVIVINVAKIAGTATWNGFWNVKGKSNNYINQMNVMNNDTGIWISSTEYYSEQYLNITARINNSTIISNYIQQTKARLSIRFPNETIWASQIQIKAPDSFGNIIFDVIKIPKSGEDYIAGEYDIIITWNNSYSTYGLNESGLIFIRINVFHYSRLLPDNQYHADVLENSIINIKVSYQDLINFDAIEGAHLYLSNFTDPGVIQDFSELSPGYYLFAFNVSGAEPGDNNVTIHANSTYYKSICINVTIEVIYDTVLTAKEMPKVEVPWNQNVTIHFNYTELYSKKGIATIPETNWNGETYTVMLSPGLYTMLLNTSLYEVNKLHSLLITMNKSGFQDQSVLIKVQINERNTEINNIFINNQNRTIEKSFALSLREILNISIQYNDLNANGAFIKNASVKIIGDGLDTNLTENILQQYYNCNINTTQLGDGVKFLTISAEKENFTSFSEIVIITITKQKAVYEVFLNSINFTSGEVYSIESGILINITVVYKDFIARNRLIGADVNLTGFGALDENLIFNQYNITINSNILAMGLNILTLFFEKAGYESISNKVYIEVTKIQCRLFLYLDGVDNTNSSSVEIPYGAELSIVIKYQSNHIPYDHISAATIRLEGTGFSVIMKENAGQGQYDYTLPKKLFDIGTRFITILAQEDAYQEKSLLLRIEVRRIAAKLVTEDEKNIINAVPGETLVIRIELKDNDFGGKVSGATVRYNSKEFGQGELKEIENGVYEFSLENIPEGEYTITITAYAGDDYEIENIEITLNVATPKGLLLAYLWLLILISCVAVGLGTYFILYYKIFRFPKPVRKVKKFRKNLNIEKINMISLKSRETSITELYLESIQKYVKPKGLKKETESIRVNNKKILKKKEEGNKE